MESILDWLCDAPIAYNARPHTPDSPALENVKARTALLDAYDDLADDAEEDFSYRKFVYGFRLGAALALEIVLGREKLLQT